MDNIIFRPKIATTSFPPKYVYGAHKQLYIQSQAKTQMADLDLCTMDQSFPPEVVKM